MAPCSRKCRQDCSATHPSHMMLWVMLHCPANRGVGACCLPVCLPACLSAWLPACLPACHLLQSRAAMLLLPEHVVPMLLPEHVAAAGACRCRCSPCCCQYGIGIVAIDHLGLLLHSGRIGKFHVFASRSRDRQCDCVDNSPPLWKRANSMEAHLVFLRVQPAI